MNKEINMFLINVLFLIITIIAFVRFLFFQGYITWLGLILIVWIFTLISIERARRQRYHERLYVKKKKKRTN
jgi:c-di-AMP phosphodiesterase-like protein